MSFDNSRFTFNPTKNYHGVIVQQGRVQTDAEWNDWVAEVNRRTQAGGLDVFGRAVYPATTPYAFEIFPVSGATKKLMIGPGRMYVDGLLAENHGDPTATVWDPALGELSNAPQPPPTAPAGGTAPAGSIDYANQPHMPTGTTLPTSGVYLARLNVWTRAITVGPSMPISSTLVSGSIQRAACKPPGR